MFYRRTRFQRQLDGFCELCTISTRTKSWRSSGTFLTHWRKENTSEIKCGLSGHEKCLFILQCVDWKIVIQGSLHPCVLRFLTSIIKHVFGVMILCSINFYGWMDFLLFYGPKYQNKFHSVLYTQILLQIKYNYWWPYPL